MRPFLDHLERERGAAAVERLLARTRDALIKTMLSGQVCALLCVRRVWYVCAPCAWCSACVLVCVV